MFYITGLLDNQLTDLKHRHETISINMQQRLLKLDEEDVQMVSSFGFSGKSGSAYAQAVGTSTATASTRLVTVPMFVFIFNVMHVQCT